jgi:hypothetical protein
MPTQKAEPAKPEEEKKENEDLNRIIASLNGMVEKFNIFMKTAKPEEVPDKKEPFKS